MDAWRQHGRYQGHFARQRVNSIVWLLHVSRWYVLQLTGLAWLLQQFKSSEVTQRRFVNGIAVLFYINFTIIFCNKNRGWSKIMTLSAIVEFPNPPPATPQYQSKGSRPETSHIPCLQRCSLPRCVYLPSIPMSGNGLIIGLENHS